MEERRQDVDADFSAEPSSSKQSLTNTDMRGWKQAFDTGSVTFQEWAEGTTWNAWENAYESKDVTFEEWMGAHAIRSIAVKERQLGRDADEENPGKGKGGDLSDEEIHDTSKVQTLSLERRAIEAGVGKVVTMLMDVVQREKLTKEDERTKQYEQGSLMGQAIHAFNVKELGRFFEQYTTEIERQLEARRDLQRSKKDFDADRITFQDWAGSTTWEAWQYGHKDKIVTLEQWMSAYALRLRMAQKRQRDWSDEIIPAGKDESSYNADEELNDIYEAQKMCSLELREIEQELKKLRKHAEEYQEGSLTRRAIDALITQEGFGGRELAHFFERYAERVEKRPRIDILEEKAQTVERYRKDVWVEFHKANVYLIDLKIKQADSELNEWQSRLKLSNITPLSSSQAEYNVGRKRHLVAWYKREFVDAEQRLNDPTLEEDLVNDVEQQTAIIESRIHSLTKLKNEINRSTEEIFVPDTAEIGERIEAYRLHGLLALCGTEIKLSELEKEELGLRVKRAAPRITGMEWQDATQKMRRAIERNIKQLIALDKLNIDMGQLDKIVARMDSLSKSGQTDTSPYPEIKQLESELHRAGANVTVGLIDFLQSEIEEARQLASGESLAKLDDESNALITRHEDLIKKAKANVDVHCERLRNEVSQLSSAQPEFTLPDEPSLRSFALRLARLKVAESDQRLLKFIVDDVEPDGSEASQTSSMETRLRSESERRLDDCEGVFAMTTRLKVLETASKGKTTKETEDFEHDALHAKLAVIWLEHQLEMFKSQVKNLNRIDNTTALEARIAELKEQRGTGQEEASSSTADELRLRQMQLKLMLERERWIEEGESKQRLHELSQRISELRTKPIMADQEKTLMENLSSQFDKSKELADLRAALYRVPSSESDKAKQLENKIGETKTALSRLRLQPVTPIYTVQDIKEMEERVVSLRMELTNLCKTN